MKQFTLTIIQLTVVSTGELRIHLRICHTYVYSQWFYTLHIQAEHNLWKLSESSYWQYEQARLNFWHSCTSSFAREQVDPELAAEFFEVCV